MTLKNKKLRNIIKQKKDFTMQRLFTEHKKRHVISLDGGFTFKTDEKNVGEAETWYKSELNGQTVVVPSVWNSTDGLLEYEGVCWYEKKFFCEGGTLRFKFGAVMTYAKVYFDGEYLGDHYGGFTSFDFIVNEVKSGEHRLTVRVDNSFDESSIPQAFVDWYHYGGITRSVDVERLSGISILGAKFDYTLESSTAVSHLTFEAYNAEKCEICDTVRFFIDNNKVCEAEIALGAGERKIFETSKFNIENVSLWSPNTPVLYTLKCESGSDDLYDRIGFRALLVKGHDVYLNGEKFRFLGVNRHEENADFGMAFPPQLMMRDIDIIKNANCNSIRGSHYPNNKIFVDMLDEAGVTFWSEIPIWGCGFSVESLKNPTVLKRGLKMLEEMVWQYYNHPSIFIWGMHNEIRSDTKEGYEMSKLYFDFLKKNGSNRIITYASNTYLEDICLEFTDVISVNIYCGWYDNGFSCINDFFGKYDKKLKELGIDKPIMITEFGAAAIYGHHTFDNLPWTEEYQASLISETIDDIFSRKEYVGSYVWQFADIRTAKEMGLNRARGFNNKGIVNEYRRPKLAYGAVRKAYKKHSL